jgi:chromosome partitioning protein
MLILIGGQKGGTGKSTLATNLVTLRKLKNYDALLYDIDEQKTSTLWASRRDENEITPRIPSTQKILDRRVLNVGVVIRNEIKDLLAKYDEIIVDAGGAANEMLRAAMVLADCLVMPLMPSAFDVWTIDTMNTLVGEAKQQNPKLKAYVVYNKVATHPQAAQQEIDESNELLSDFEHITALDVHLVYRKSVRQSQKKGVSVVEYKPADKKAIEEIQSIYREVFSDGE